MKGSLNNEINWWTNPTDCLFALVSTKSFQDSCPVFCVCDVKLEDKATCGGALILKDGAIRAMFSGPVTCKEWFGRDITTIKTALDILKLAGWDKTREVAVESENKILLNWLANSLQKPWGLSKLLVEVDVMDALLCWALVVLVLLCLPYLLVTAAV
ncbi:hypothetical protein V6N13_049175 [Hibiscus sabdariffa]